MKIAASLPKTRAFSQAVASVFLRPRRGVATRYLDNYLSWFHLVGLAPGANHRACLAAAVTR